MRVLTQQEPLDRDRIKELLLELVYNVPYVVSPKTIRSSPGVTSLNFDDWSYLLYQPRITTLWSR